MTIFGVTGNFVASIATSNAHRTQATGALIQSEESLNYAGLDLPSGYNEVPNINTDDDGYTGENVTYVNRSGWNANTCGTSGTLIARIADCAAHGVIGAEASWDGATKGNAGMGLWKLVSRTGNCTSLGVNCKEVWQDQRTGLLWSSLLANSAGFNWCQATGHNNSSSVTTGPKQVDPNNVCNNSSYQNTTTPPISACFEHANFATTYNNDPGKSGLNKASSPSVRWRTPSIFDYKQADVNGIRFVLPDMGINSSSLFETLTTVISGNTLSSWLYNPKDGEMNNPYNRTYAYPVRCVGR